MREGLKGSQRNKLGGFERGTTACKGPEESRQDHGGAGLGSDPSEEPQVGEGQGRPRAMLATEGTLQGPT